MSTAPSATTAFCPFDLTLPKLLNDSIQNEMRTDGKLNITCDIISINYVLAISSKIDNLCRYIIKIESIIFAFNEIWIFCAVMINCLLNINIISSVYIISEVSDWLVDAQGSITVLLLLIVDFLRLSCFTVFSLVLKTNFHGALFLYTKY